jgi:hypothetical protein
LIKENDVKDFGEFAESLNMSEKENNSLDHQEEFDIEKENSDLNNQEEFNIQNDQKSLNEYDWDSSTKFHFAMSSQWHEGKTHKVTLEKTNLSSSLSSWLEGCVKYIKDQLKYVDR